MIKPWSLLQGYDEDVYQLLEGELHRQQEGLELIASENFPSPQVIACLGNVAHNKYAEGRPGKRYYGGCEVIDRLENLAIDRLCRLFQAKFANVQPHSGAQANAAVLLALAKPGDVLLGMDLTCGGHLTHGSGVNFSGIYYKAASYGVNPQTGLVDYNAVRRAALTHKPKVLIAGASAYARHLDFAAFRAIADEVGAYLWVDMAHIAGLVCTGLHPSPIPHAHVVTSTTHKTLRGPRGGVILWNDDSLSAVLNKGVFPGTQGGPLEHVIAAKAVCFQEALLPSFKDYQVRVLANSQALATALMHQGFALATQGTDNHLLLVDLGTQGKSGKDMEEQLGQVAMTVNKNTIPGETRSPFITSGIRFGTPAVTSQGLDEGTMVEIAGFVKKVYERGPSAELRREVLALASRYPLYPYW